MTTRNHCWLVWAMVAAVAPAAAAWATDSWPQWRGPLGTGVAPDATPPLTWSEDENVRWKIRIPGIGHSTPIVYGDHVFVTSAVPFGETRSPRYSGAPGAHDNAPVTQKHRFIAMLINRKDGSVQWQRTLREALPHEGGHFTSSLASHSPVTDGDRFVAFFGSHGIYSLKPNGDVEWEKQLGRMSTKHGHGEGSSPALFGDTVAINWDHEGQSFVIALDKTTGDERWKVNRNEVTSWATPIIVEVENRAQVIVCGTNRIRGYDLATGKTIWECGGLSANIVATPVASDGMLYAASSYDTRAMLAIQLVGARGDITGSDKILWSRTRGTPYVPSPLLYDGSLYFLRHYQGILTRVDAQSGDESQGPFRLLGIHDVYASPVGAAERVYITDLDGTTAAISNDEIPRVLAVNRLEDSFSASAAIAGNDLFLRGSRHLYCLAED